MNDRPIGQMYIYTCISLFKKHLCDFVDLCHFLSLQKTSYEEKTSSVTYSTVSLYRTCVQNQQETNHARVKKKPTRNVSKTVDLKGTSLFFRPSGVVALQKNISAILIYMSQRHLLHHRPQAIYSILSIIHMVLFNILHFQWLIKAVMLYKNRLL